MSQVVERQSTSRDPGRGLVVASVALAAVAAAYLALAPMVMVVQESRTVTAGSTAAAGASPGQELDAERSQETLTLPEAQGWASVAIVAGPPLVVTALPLLARARTHAIVLRTVATVLLWAWVFLGAFSFGLSYLPSAALMLVSAIVASVRR